MNEPTLWEQAAALAVCFAALYAFSILCLGA